MGHWRILLSHLFVQVTALTGQSDTWDTPCDAQRWLRADGIPPAQVAEWAGNSVPVLLATYARCIHGQLSDLKRRMEAGGDLPELSD